MRTTISRLWFITALAVAPACGDGGGDAPPIPDAAGADATPTTLYQRLGEEAGIRTVITGFVGRVVADPKINGYFLNGAVDGGRLINCLVKQVGNATGGPQVYPDPAGTGDGCRDMASSHAGLGISGNDLNDLVGHLVAELTAAGVATADIEAIGTVLGGLAPDIVEDADSNATVYQRVGRKPAITLVVGNFIGRVAADTRINGFFATTDIPRLTTCLVRQVCSIDGPCAYGDEVDGAEPGVSATAPCRDMASSHTGLRSGGSPITIEDFDALVEDLVLELTAAGVTESDRGAVLGALGPLCPMIVAGGTGCP